MWLRVAILVHFTIASLNAVALQGANAKSTPKKQLPNPKALKAVGPLQVAPAPTISLRADRKSALVGETVTFSLEPAASVTQSRYSFKFNFDDGPEEELTAGESH